MFEQRQLEIVEKILGNAYVPNLIPLPLENNNDSIAKKIDHTILSPTAREETVLKICKEYKEFGFRSVCCYSSWVPLVRSQIDGKIACVVGFPHGAQCTETKLGEIAYCVKYKVNEIDMVMNIGRFLDGDYVYVYEELAKASQLCHAHGIRLKVILETCYLDTDEMVVDACILCMLSGVDCVKTSTGFGTGGAKVETVKLMRSVVGSKHDVKASGGIRTFEDANMFIKAGASILGCSAGVSIVSKQIDSTSDY